MCNPGWTKAIASLAGGVMIIIGAVVFCLGGDSILCVLAILGGAVLAVDPLGTGGS